MKYNCDVNIFSFNIVICFLCSYSKGLGGLVGRILGNDHILNIPNSYIGLIFFPLLMILSEFYILCVLQIQCYP